MTDTVPDNIKRIAYFIGLGLHPVLIVIGTLLLLLWGLPLSDTIRWTALVAGVVLIPIFATTAYLQRQDQYTYHIGLHCTSAVARMGTDTDEKSYSRAGRTGLCRRASIGSIDISIFSLLDP